MIRKFKKNSKLYTLFFLVLILLTISIFQPIVKNIAYKVMPMKNITITVLNEKNEASSGNEVFISGYGVGNMTEFAANDTSLLDSFKNSKGNIGFEYLPSDPYFTNFIFSNKIDGKIIIQGKAAPNFWISTLQRGTGGIISIKCDGVEQKYDLYSEKEITHKIYPFEFQKNIAIMWILIYVALYAAIFVFMVIVSYLILRFIEKFELPQKIIREYNFIVGFIIFLLICFIYCIVSYKNGVIFNQIGDATYYWNICTTVETQSAGNFNFFNYGKIDTLTFRGYLFPFIIWVLRKISFGNVYMSYILYWIMSSAVTAILLGVVFPKLYRILTGKLISYIQVFTFGILYLLFWRMLSYVVLTDLYSSTLFFTAILLLFIYLKKSKWTYMFGTGISLGGAILIRGNYILAFYGISIVMIIAVCIRILKKRDVNICKSTTDLYIHFKNINSIHFICFFIGVAIICIPQMMMNYARGMLAMFPYDHVGVWQQPLQTLTEFAGSLGYYSALQGHPYQILNSVGRNVIDYLYPGVDIYHIGTYDLIFIVIAKPMQALTIFITRLFLLMDIKNWEEYPKIQPYFTNPMYLLFSLLNYIVWGLTAANLGMKKIRKIILNNKELSLSALIFIFLGVPQVLYIAEWRYFINIYMLSYYIIGYSFIDALINESSREIIIKYKNYIITNVLFVVVISFMVSTILYTGFGGK